MQAIKSLFRQSTKPASKRVPAPANGRGPTPLTPAEMKAVAGGLPRGGWAPEAIALAQE